MQPVPYSRTWNQRALVLHPIAIAHCLTVVLVLLGCPAVNAETPGVVSHIKVLSDKVADVSSMDAWKASFIKPGMSDREKAIAAWQSSCAFVYQDAPATEFLHEGCVHDAIKAFNVYGYGQCCCASGRIEQFARYTGLQARGLSVNLHSVPEVYWDNQWHMLDASLLNYFTRADGQIASVSEITNAVESWLAEHPGFKGNNDKLMAFQKAEGWTGWTKGPALLTNATFYDGGGWWPAKTHGWYSTMQEFDGTHHTPFVYEYGYSQGYEVNIQLRRGERLTRNWFSHGLHVNGVLGDGGEPGCLKEKVGEGSLAVLRKMGDLTEGRIGSGLYEYEIPLAAGSFRSGALAVDNIATQNEDQHGPAVHLKNAGAPGSIEFDIPTSYVYLNGKINVDAVVGASGKIHLLFSDNNGLDWREIGQIDKSGTQEIDITKAALRHYDYRLRMLLEGQDTGLNRLKISHEIQCSQRALPTLGQGANTITFSAGASEGTVTIEGATQSDKKGKNVTPLDFHPILKDINPDGFSVNADGASITFPIAAPGEIKRLRMGGHYRLRDKRDQWEMQVSYDGGQTFKTVDTQTGPYQGICKYIAIPDVPSGTKSAQVRWVGTMRNTTCLFSLRIDADYQQPHGGFAPVKITYIWEEDGVEKRNMHIAKAPNEAYIITCGQAPRVKSIVMELAD